jgi:hypothetical protein
MLEAQKLWDLGWILLLVSLISPALAENVDLAARNDAFINYKEGPSQCTDRLPDCHDRAIGNGCAYNAFVMRTFCPVACDHERCSHRGTRRVRCFRSNAAHPDCKGAFCPALTQADIRMHDVGCMQAKHKGHASMSGTLTFQQIMTQQLGIPRQHWKSVQLLVSGEGCD